MHLKRVFLFIVIASFFSSCITQPEASCIRIGEADYIFNLPVTVHPLKDTFDIGDTITITSEFSERIEEVNSGNMMDLINWDFYPRTFLYKIDEPEYLDTVLSSFEVLVDDEYFYPFFEFNDGEKILKGSYLYENGKYKLEYKLIPTESGLYFHKLSSAIYTFAPESEFEDKCLNKGVKGYVKMTNQEDNNVDFLLDSPDPEAQIWHERRDKAGATFNNTGGYCFYVR